MMHICMYQCQVGDYVCNCVKAVHLVSWCSGVTLYLVYTSSDMS